MMRTGGREVVVDRTVEGLYCNALKYVELWKARALAAEERLASTERSCASLEAEVFELRQSVASLLVDQVESGR